MKSAIERVARVLCSHNGRPEDVLLAERPMWMSYAEEARMILMALREPTDSQIFAAESGAAKLGAADLAALWRAMIDAAIMEG